MKEEELARKIWLTTGRLVPFMTGRYGVGYIDIARGSSSHRAEKAHGDQRSPLDGRFGTT